MTRSAERKAQQLEAMNCSLKERLSFSEDNKEGAQSQVQQLLAAQQQEAEARQHAEARLQVRQAAKTHSFALLSLYTPS